MSDLERQLEAQLARQAEIEEQKARVKRGELAERMKHTELEKQVEQFSKAADANPLFLITDAGQLGEYLKKLGVIYHRNVEEILQEFADHDRNVKTEEIDAAKSLLETADQQFQLILDRLTALLPLIDKLNANADYDREVSTKIKDLIDKELTGKW